MVLFGREFSISQLDRFARRRSRPIDKDGHAREAAARKLVAASHRNKIEAAVALAILDGTADLWVKQRKLPPN